MLFASCQKKEMPAAVNGNPVFLFDGTIGNDTLHYQAGANHLFLYTGFYKETSSGLLFLKSYFAPDNCTNCEPYLSIEIADHDSSSGMHLASTIQDLLHGGGAFYSYSYDSIMSSINTETFTFIPTIPPPGATYTWNFGDGTSSTVASPTHTFSGGGVRHVSLSILSGGSIDTLSNDIQTDFQSSCRVQFNVVPDSSLPGLTWVIANSSIFQYAWDFGDGHTGVGVTDSNIYSASGKYTISLTATAPSCTAIYRKHVFVNTSSSADASFSYTTAVNSVVTYTQRINTSACMIRYRKDGKEYASVKPDPSIDQSGKTVLQISGFEAYTPDANGNPTMKLRGSVDTYLYNQANGADSIRIQSKSLIFAVAYPK